MPLNVLVPQLTLKSAKELANLHDMYMPSQILLKNAHILLENHKVKLVQIFLQYLILTK
jgi:predicted nucleotidyltransferase